MKTAVSAFGGPIRWRAWAGLAGLALGLACGAGGLQAQAYVQTLGGGHADYYGVPYGFVDGDTLEQAMFNSPASPTIGPDGNLWIVQAAAGTNGAIRKLLLATGQTRTVMVNTNFPVGLVTGPDRTFYVLTRADGAIRRYDTNLNLVATITTALVSPNAFVMDSSANFYVAQANGTVVRVSAGNPVPVTIGTGLNNPGGIAITLFGNLAVADTGNHVIKVIDPSAAPSAGVVFSGTGTAGFKNGDATIAQFDSPAGIAVAPNGQFLVADRLNHRVRLVYTNGHAATLYGVGPDKWVADIAAGLGVGYNGLNVWPGWADGPYDPTDPWKVYPAGMQPLGICYGASNTVYTTEVGYHIVRQVTGISLIADGGGGPGTVVEPVDVPEPVITPDRGYFPNGQLITVGSTVPDVFYTLDGTTPTTNSYRVPMSGNRGTIWWNNPTNDLSKLSVRAWIGTNSSDVVTGQPITINTIGVTPSVSSNYLASPGSTIFLPVVVNLIPGAQMQSVFYRVEVRAAAGVPNVSDQFRLVPISTNDYITMVGLPKSSLTAMPYGDVGGTLGGRRGLLVSAVGTNLGGGFTSFGTLNMLAVPIPAGAPAGGTYTVSIINPSATSDGAQTPLAITAYGAATIVVGGAASNIGVATNANGGVGNIVLPAGAVGYLVGDSSPSGWFNAGEFGDGNLNNADVNNAFYASLGLRVPPTFSDAFDAMDAFPLDTPGLNGWGGDGEIRFLDWQVILQRASRLDENNYIRVRLANGQKNVLGPGDFTLQGSPDLPVTPIEARPGSVWVRQAQFIAGIVENAQPGQVVDVPVYVRLRAGSTLSGLSFSAAVRPRSPNGIPVTDAVFVLNPGAPTPSRTSDGDANVGRDTLYRVWEYIPTGIRAGDTLLGHIRFTIPARAAMGDVYRVRFLAGSGGDTTVTPWREPQFESLPGAVYVGVPATVQPARISDEWKRRFFGDVDSPNAAPEADPDEDGVPNWKEFLAGTNPANADSRLNLRPQGAANRSVSFTVLTAPDKTYQLEYTTSLQSSVWTTSGTITGDGNYQEIVVPLDAQQPRFYRLRLLP